MATTLTPYLSFPGNTRTVFAFYAQALGGTIEAMLSHGDMPPPPADQPVRLAHAVLNSHDVKHTRGFFEGALGFVLAACLGRVRREQLRLSGAPTPTERPGSEWKKFQSTRPFSV